MLYRIKQIDLDGKFSYSRVATVNFKAKPGIRITPNPSTDFIMISMNANLNPATVRIFDPGGRLVFKKELIINTSVKIPLSDLRTGWWLLEVQRDGEKHTQKFLKQ